MTATDRKTDRTTGGMGMDPAGALSLVADIGGTNTRVALARAGVLLPETIRRFANAGRPALEPILTEYLAGATGALATGALAGGPLAGACIAAAGPVSDGRAVMTNLAWVIEADTVAQATGAGRVALLNDLQAQGHALGHLAPGALAPVLTDPGGGPAAGPMLVVGLGTGVNAAPVHGAGAGRVVPPSECGHVNLPVREAEDLALMRFVEGLLASRGEAPHCGVEEVLSGRGLANLAAFCAAEAGRAPFADSAAVLAALDAGDPVAMQTARLYTRVLAQFLADQALVHLPLGGIFLIGGMARAMAPHLASNGFEAIFRAPRRVDLLSRSVAISVVEDDYAALTGCAAFLQSQLVR